MGKKQYFDRNIRDMSIDITYFVLDILQVGISRATYYISFEQMCLTEKESTLKSISTGLLWWLSSQHFRYFEFKVFYVSCNIGPGNQNISA